MFTAERFSTNGRTVGIALALVLTLLAAASLGAPRTAQADTWVACSKPTVSGPVRAADGRVYVRGYSNGCTATWRITITLKRNGVPIASNTNYYWSGGGGAGVFSPSGCTRGAGYQGVAVVAAYYNGAWRNVTYGTSSTPRAMC